MGRKGHTWLVLVFPLDLQNVEEVGCCGVDLDEILVWCWLGVWEVCDFQFLGSLWLWLGAVLFYGLGEATGFDIFGDLDASHCDFVMVKSCDGWMYCRRQYLLLNQMTNR